MSYDMHYASVSYTDWRVRETCFNDDEERNDKIWSAYSSMRFFYGKKASTSSRDFHDEEPNTAFYGACGVYCSELIEDEAPEPIMAAFLCGPAMDHPHPASYDEIMERGFGKQTWDYVRSAVALRRTNLADYNKMLASGLSEEVLAIEAATLRCKAERAILDYQNAERTQNVEFEYHDRLLLCANDPVATELSLCYDRIAVLLGYIPSEWRLSMITLKASITWAAEMVYGTSLWPLPGGKLD